MPGFTDMRSLLANSVAVFFQVLYILIFVRIVLSWFPLGQGSKIREFFYILTEPILGPIRALLQKSPLGGGMMLDFSPIIALFIMQIIRTVLLQLIYML